MTSAQGTALKNYVGTLGADAVRAALEKAKRNNAKSWSYVDVILRDLIQKGTATAAVGNTASPDGEANQRSKEDMDRMRKFMAQEREKEKST